MGLKTEVDAIFNLEFNPDNIRQIVLPAAAASPACAANAAGATYGAWVDVALAATVTVPTLIVGLCLGPGSAIDVFTVDIGSCLVLGTNYANAAAVIAAGAPVIAAAHRQEVRVQWSQTGAAGGYVISGWVPLSTPIFIPALVGIIARCYGITAAAVTMGVSVVCKQGF
jgi:hypothetical protein